MTEEDKKRLYSFIDEASENGTHFRGLSYEDGLKDMLELLDGDITVKIITTGI